MMLANVGAPYAATSSWRFRPETIIYVTSFIRARRFYNSVFQCQPEQNNILAGTTEYLLPHRLVTLKKAPYGMAGSRDTALRILVDDFFYEYQRLQSLGIPQAGRMSECRDGEMSMKISDEDGNILTIVAK